MRTLEAVLPFSCDREIFVQGCDGSAGSLALSWVRHVHPSFRARTSHDNCRSVGCSRATIMLRRPVRRDHGFDRNSPRKIEEHPAVVGSVFPRSQYAIAGIRDSGQSAKILNTRWSVMRRFDRRAFALGDSVYPIRSIGEPATAIACNRVNVLPLPGTPVSGAFVAAQ